MDDVISNSYIIFVGILIRGEYGAGSLERYCIAIEI